MKIAFFGSGAFGLPTLEALAEQHELVGVVTQPDRPAGRKRTLTPTPIGAWTADNLPNTRLEKPENVNTLDFVSALHSWEADAWVVIAFGQKLSKQLLDGVFAINLHASLLPRWRGAAPIHRAIEAGDTVTGNSVITLADKMDAGLILGTSRRAITPEVRTGEMHDLLASDGPALVLEVLANHNAGTLRPVAQDEADVTLAKKLTKAEGTLDFTLDARRTRCKVHGLTPWPGITVILESEPIKLLRVQELDEHTSEAPATLFDTHRGCVACAQGTVLQLLEVQPPGKRPMSWSDFARGRALPSGAMLSALGTGAE